MQSRVHCVLCCTDPQGTDLDDYDMHCITSVVTAFLGQLPTSLISPFLYKDFIRAASKYHIKHYLELQLNYDFWTTRHYKYVREA